MSRARAVCVLLLLCVASYLNPFLLWDVTGNVHTILCVSKTRFLIFYGLFFFFFVMGAVDLDNRMVFHCSQKVLVVLSK